LSKIISVDLRKVGFSSSTHRQLVVSHCLSLVFSQNSSADEWQQQFLGLLRRQTAEVELNARGWFYSTDDEFVQRQQLSEVPPFCLMQERKLVERECPDGANFGAMMSRFKVCSVGG